MNCFSTRQSTNQFGFTLIEMMIVVAIMAILAAIAYPSYTEYIERGRRSDAKAVTLEAAQYVERRYTETATYTGITLPTSYQRSPREGNKWYDITYTTSTSTTYSLAASPKTGWTPSKCGTLSVDQLGVKTISTSSVAADVDSCWNR